MEQWEIFISFSSVNYFTFLSAQMQPLYNSISSCVMTRGASNQVFSQTSAFCIPDELNNFGICLEYLITYGFVPSTMALNLNNNKQLIIFHVTLAAHLKCSPLGHPLSLKHQFFCVTDNQKQQKSLIGHLWGLSWVQWYWFLFIIKITQNNWSSSMLSWKPVRMFSLWSSFVSKTSIFLCHR